VKVRASSATTDPGKALKRGPYRSVFLVAGGESGTDVVIKRFCHPHPLKRLRDGVRARREYRLLAHLHANGVRVPRPLALVDAGPARDVRMEAVPGATSLEHLFAERARPAGGWEAFLERLGRELARVQAARVHLRDLGSKNVLVDGEGRPWLIDFHDARIRTRACPPAAAFAEVVAAAAAGRESLAPRLRLRFLAAWRRAAGTRDSIDLIELEARARLRRRDTIAKGIGRWLRESSRCTAHDTTLTRRGRASSPVVIATDDLPLEQARRRWLSAARLLEHGLPVAQPGELERRGATARVVFDAPSRWLAEEELRERLLDRGLALESWTDALLTDDVEGVALRPPERLLEI